MERPPKQIDIVPAIIGQGVVVAAVGAVALGVGIAGSMGAIVMSATMAQIFIAVGIGLISAGVQAMLGKRGGGSGVKTPEQVVGTASSIDQSFAFNTAANMATQGSVVPVGYGRLRVGSSVIQSTIKSYPMNIRSTTVKTSDYARADVQSQGRTSSTELVGSFENWTKPAPTAQNPNNEPNIITDWATIESRLNQTDNG